MEPKSVFEVGDERRWKLAHSSADSLHSYGAHLFGLICAIFILMFAYPLSFFAVTIIPHACKRFKEMKMGMTTLGARIIGNSKMKTNPGSFIQ